MNTSSSDLSLEQEESARLLSEFFQSLMLLRHWRISHFEEGCDRLSEAFILEAIDRHPDLTVDDLGRFLDMSSGSLSQYVGPAADIGLLTKTGGPGTDDLHLALTDSGKMRLDHLKQYPSRFLIDKLVEGLSASETETVVEALRVLRDKQEAYFAQTSRLVPIAF